MNSFEKNDSPSLYIPIIWTVLVIFFAINSHNKSSLIPSINNSIPIDERIKTKAIVIDCHSAFRINEMTYTYNVQFQGSTNIYTSTRSILGIDCVENENQEVDIIYKSSNPSLSFLVKNDYFSSQQSLTTIISIASIMYVWIIYYKKKNQHGSVS